MNRDKVENEHRMFRVALLCTIGTGAREYSVRKYLSGFSEAVVPEAAAAREKVEAVLAWMSNGPPRLEANDGKILSPHDPTDSPATAGGVWKRYGCFPEPVAQCGTGDAAAVAAHTRTDCRARGSRGAARRWIIVGPTYRVMLNDAQGNPLTRKDLHNPATFLEATSQIPKCLPEDNYEDYVPVRLSSVPLHRFHIREQIDRFFPGWDEYLGCSLLLERRSFLFFFLSVNALVCLLILRVILGVLADRHFRVPRFGLRNKPRRAIAAFFSAPEIK
jgi:hypothetical protein